MTINTGGAALSIARWFAHEFGPVRVVGRDHREPAVLPERDLGLLLEAEDFGIEDACSAPTSSSVRTRQCTVSC
jgi:hypothetical protein